MSLAVAEKNSQILDFSTKNPNSAELERDLDTQNLICAGAVTLCARVAPALPAN